MLTEEQILSKCQVKSLEEVKNINLWGNEIKNIDIIAKMKNIEVVSMSMNKIESLKPLANCEKLKELYDLDTILDTIDLYLAPLKENYSWGYSIPAFLAGIFKSHPNNIIFLTEKYRINNKDLKYIVAGIEEEKRQVYDYNNIAKLYEEYFSVYYEDKESIRNLKDKIENRNVVILAPGKSIVDYSDKIQEVINEQL